MRRRSAEPGRLAPLDGGSSRRTTVMRLCPGQPAYISLIRRRRRLILRCAPSPSETLLPSEDPIRQRIHLTVGPSISELLTGRRSHEFASDVCALACHDDSDGWGRLAIRTTETTYLLGRPFRVCIHIRSGAAPTVPSWCAEATMHVRIEQLDLDQMSPAHNPNEAL